MRQQINLYQERFHEKRLWVSARQVALAAMLLLVIGGAWSFLLAARLDSALERHRALQADRESLSVELASVNAELSRLLQDDRVDRQIENTARQISARKKVLNFVGANRFGSGQGFSRYLVALSRLDVDAIWLSEIRLGEGYIGIKGSSLDAAVVPAYLDRFSGQAVFVGNRFDLFRVSRNREHEWKVDFEIATRGELDE